MANTTLAEARKFVQQHKRMARETREHIKERGLEPGSPDYLYYEREAKSHDEYARGWQEYVDGYHGGCK